MTAIDADTDMTANLRTLRHAPNPPQTATPSPRHATMTSSFSVSVETGSISSPTVANTAIVPPLTPLTIFS